MCVCVCALLLFEDLFQTTWNTLFDELAANKNAVALGGTTGPQAGPQNGVFQASSHTSISSDNELYT